MHAGWDGKYVEIAGVSLTHYAWNGPDDPARERQRPPGSAGSALDDVRAAVARQRGS
jgi:hypothetical protein